MGISRFWRNLNSATDDELMAAIQNGNQKAFQALFERHGGHLLGYSQRLLGGNRARAEDLTQDVWMKVIRFSRNYRPNGNFVAWLRTVARNTLFNDLRKERNWREVEERLQTESSDVSAGFDLEIEAQQNFEQVKKQLEELPAAQRAALTLHTVDELSYEQIAAEMNLSLSAVKSLIFRARRALLKHRGNK